MQSGYVGNEGRLFLLRTREPVPTSVRIFIALTVHIRFADFCDNALMLRHTRRITEQCYTVKQHAVTVKEPGCFRWMID